MIASSDSDFAPLVARLREKGCRVVGIGQQGKTGDETQAVYDEYEVLTHHKPRAAAAAAAKPVARKTPARKAPPPRAPAKAAPRKAAPAPAPALPEKALQILRALPEVARGDTVELNVAAAKLRELRLLSRSASSTRLFQQFPEVFVLEPADHPHKLRTTRAFAV